MIDGLVAGGLSLAVFLVILGGALRLSDRLARRPGAVCCPRCEARMTADLGTIGGHMNAVHGIERHRGSEQ